MPQRPQTKIEERTLSVGRGVGKNKGRDDVLAGIRSLVYVVQLSIFGVHCHMKHDWFRRMFRFFDLSPKNNLPKLPVHEKNQPCLMWQCTPKIDS